MNEKDFICVLMELKGWHLGQCLGKVKANGPIYVDAKFFLANSGGMEHYYRSDGLTRVSNISCIRDPYDQ